MSKDCEAVAKMMTDLGCTAKRVTIELIKSHIRSVEYKTVEINGQKMMFCGIKMDNGFVAVGKPATCIDPANWRDEIGQKISYDNSFEELWKLEAYRLMSKELLILTLTADQIKDLAEFVGITVATGDCYAPDTPYGIQDGPIYGDGKEVAYNGLFAYSVDYPAEGILQLEECERDGTPDPALHDTSLLALIKELAQLRGRLSKLNALIDGGSDVFAGLSIAEQCDLRAQATYMADYADVLERRIARF